jgi:hypothetical protein
MPTVDYAILEERSDNASNLCLAVQSLIIQRELKKPITLQPAEEFTAGALVRKYSCRGVLDTFEHARLRSCLARFFHLLRTLYILP